LPVQVLSRVFRGKFVPGLKALFHKHRLQFFGASQHLADAKAFHAFLRTLFREDWIVYAKSPLGGPEHVLHYLARYTHRVAISNHRLLKVTDRDLTFRWKDYVLASATSARPQLKSRAPLAGTKTPKTYNGEFRSYSAAWKH
jgi:Putative transposase